MIENSDEAAGKKFRRCLSPPGVAIKLPLGPEPNKPPRDSPAAHNGRNDCAARAAGSTSAGLLRALA
jgi:hypothetical protein